MIDLAAVFDAGRVRRWHANPDLSHTDNCAKAIMDGLNRIAWADDAQVFLIVARKVWAETARTLVTVERIGA